MLKAQIHLDWLPATVSPEKEVADYVWVLGMMRERSDIAILSSCYQLSMSVLAQLRYIPIEIMP